MHDISHCFPSLAGFFRDSVNDVAGVIAAVDRAADDALRRFPASELNNPPAPAVPHWLPPLDEQEVWAAGVTYTRSREAPPGRIQRWRRCLWPAFTMRRARKSSTKPAPKIQSDTSTRSASAAIRLGMCPSPELGLVINPAMQLLGFTIGNDMSSRDIEGANPLYLPQAKLYTASCALGPGILPGAIRPVAGYHHPPGHLARGRSGLQRRDLYRPDQTQHRRTDRLSGAQQQLCAGRLSADRPRASCRRPTSRCCPAMRCASALTASAACKTAVIEGLAWCDARNWRRCDCRILARPPRQPIISPANHQARIDAALARAAQDQLDALIVYGDREHFANLSYLTGYDPRFEEALLILRPGQTPQLLVGNEGLHYSQIASIPLVRRLYQTFSLPGQPRGDSPAPGRSPTRMWAYALGSGWAWSAGNLLTRAKPTIRRIRWISRLSSLLRWPM